MYKILCTNSVFTKEEIKKAREKDLELVPIYEALSKDALIAALQECDGVILNGGGARILRRFYFKSMS